MFGHHKLYQEGAQARGVIISVRYGVTHLDLLVEVQFDDGTHGRLSEKVKKADVGDCNEGDILPVRYDPRDRSKLVLDMPVLEANKYVPKENTGQQSQQAQFSVGSAGPAGAGVAGLSALLGGGSMADMIREARRDPQGLRDRLIEQAQASGAQVFVRQSDGTLVQPGRQAADDGLGMEPSLETDPDFQVQPQFQQEQFQQAQFEQAQFQVQPQAPAQFQMPSPPHKQPEPGDFDPDEEF